MTIIVVMKRRVKIPLALTAASAMATIGWYLHIAGNIQQQQSACFAELAEVLERGADHQTVFNTELERLQLLVEQSLVARAEMLAISQRLKANTDAPLSSRDLLTLKSGSESYLKTRQGLYRIAQAYECAVDARLETLARYGIDWRLRLKALMLSLGAALTLYDNYLLGVVMFEHDDRLRRVLNDPDMGFGLVANRLAEATLAANSVEVRHRARRAIKFYESQRVSIADESEDSDFAYLAQLIDNSPSYNYVKSLQVGEIAGNKIQAFEKIAVDTLADASANGVDVLSGLFGNTVGLYESRKGKLYGDQQALDTLKSVLQPLDIILEKTPFRLTDKLIPGHFGHVAIWTGSRAELVAAGVWNEPVVQQYAEAIGDPDDPTSKDRRLVVEALRDGVQLNTLEHFMNVDDVAVLRPVFDSESAPQLRREALLMAFRQVGKKYDFNFDVNTTDKIVCSELAYVAFPSLDWPTERTLGRHSISPDNVAQLAWNNVPLRLVMFYHDGELVPADQQVSKMKELMLN